MTVEQLEIVLESGILLAFCWLALVFTVWAIGEVFEHIGDKKREERIKQELKELHEHFEEQKP